jgi:8-oxo-dGTP diphosphatase
LKHIVVVGAVILSEGRVLCAQRGGAGPLAGKWEFPGGKVEPDEAPESALAREIKEELGCDIRVDKLVTTTVHKYDFAIVALTTFYCTLIDGWPELTEHAELRWLSAHELGSLDWAPADVPAVALVEKQLISNSNQ